MSRSVQDDSTRERIKAIERSSSKKAQINESLPLEVMQLLDVLARIEVRRQERLSELAKDAS